MLQTLIGQKKYEEEMSDEESRRERKVQVIKIMGKTYWEKKPCSQAEGSVTLNEINSSKRYQQL